MYRNTKVIAGFPGVGKSFYRTKENQFKILDSDSSVFHWMIDANTGEKKENPNFIDDYIHHIKQNLGEVDAIFVSTHKEVLDALEENNISYSIILPDPSLKEEFIRRYKKRKSPEAFIQKLDENFEPWIKELGDRDVKKFYIKKPDQYITRGLVIMAPAINAFVIKNYKACLIDGYTTYNTFAEFSTEIPDDYEDDYEIDEERDTLGDDDAMMYRNNERLTLNMKLKGIDVLDVSVGAVNGTMMTASVVYTTYADELAAKTVRKTFDRELRRAEYLIDSKEDFDLFVKSIGKLLNDVPKMCIPDKNAYFIANDFSKYVASPFFSYLFKMKTKFTQFEQNDQ